MEGQKSAGWAYVALLAAMLISFGTSRIGATRAALFPYTVPVFVAVESVLFLASELRAYQAVGALLVVGGVFIVSRFRVREPHPSEVHH